jgi:hypothetical protein
MSIAASVLSIWTQGLQLAASFPVSGQHRTAGAGGSGVVPLCGFYYSEETSLHRSQIFREFVSDAGSGSGILRLRRTIPLLFAGDFCGLGLQSTLCAGLLLPLGVASWRRARVYDSQETLWTDTVAKNPHCCVGHNDLGLVCSWVLLAFRAS